MKPYKIVKKYRIRFHDDKFVIEYKDNYKVQNIHTYLERDKNGRVCGFSEGYKTNDPDDSDYSDDSDDPDNIGNSDYPYYSNIWNKLNEWVDCYDSDEEDAYPKYPPECSKDEQIYIDKCRRNSKICWVNLVITCELFDAKDNRELTVFNKLYGADYYCRRRIDDIIRQELVNRSYETEYFLSRVHIEIQHADLDPRSIKVP